jgi:hypothetical protein
MGLANGSAKVLVGYKNPSHKAQIVISIVLFAVWLLIFLDALTHTVLSGLGESGYVLLFASAAIFGFIFGLIDGSCLYTYYSSSRIPMEHAELGMSLQLALMAIVSALTLLIGVFLLRGPLSFEEIYPGQDHICPVF